MVQILQINLNHHFLHQIYVTMRNKNYRRIMKYLISDILDNAFQITNDLRILSIGCFLQHSEFRDTRLKRR